MAGQKIRIRLKAYDHEVIDSSARKIVDTVTRTGARVAGPVPLPTEKNVYCVNREDGDPVPTIQQSVRKGRQESVAKTKTPR